MPTFRCPSTTSWPQCTRAPALSQILAWVFEKDVNILVPSEYRTLPYIECFHSRGQRLCKFIGTKESVCIRKKFDSHRIGLGHQHGRHFVVLDWPIWPPWRHVKTLYTANDAACERLEYYQSSYSFELFKFQDFFHDLPQFSMTLGKAVTYKKIFKAILVLRYFYLTQFNR